MHHKKLSDHSDVWRELHESLTTFNYSEVRICLPQEPLQAPFPSLQVLQNEANFRTPVHDTSIRNTLL